MSGHGSDEAVPDPVVIRVTTLDMLVNAMPQGPARDTVAMAVRAVKALEGALLVAETQRSGS